MPGEWPQRCPRCRQMALRHDSMQARVACEACQWDVTERHANRIARALAGLNVVVILAVVVAFLALTVGIAWRAVRWAF